MLKHYRFSHLVIGFLLICMTCSVLASRTGTAKPSLMIYNWPDYVDPVLVAEFEKEFDAHVDFTYFESDEVRDKEIVSTDGAGFDVLVVNEVQMGSYIKRGWIAPLDLAALPNLEHIDPRWRNAFNGLTEGYGVPYFIGTLGIAWRNDLYPNGLSSWHELLKPAPDLSGRIMMGTFGRELVGVALKAEGHSVNTPDLDLIGAAGELLRKQKPYVNGYGAPAVTEESSLITGETWATPIYSGDVLMLQELDERIEYRLPDEGGMLWIDYLTVGGQSKHKELANAFINFLNRPSTAARNSEFTYCATPNQAALKYVSDEYLANPIIYPSDEQLARLEILLPLPARSTKKINTIVSELQAP